MVLGSDLTAYRYVFVLGWLLVLEQANDCGD
uniref:Uncharacterized protein n=1 Tax=Arundo donax TaxID=35708 RepID=A0A0A8YHD6_ARUDO